MANDISNIPLPQISVVPAQAQNSQTPVQAAANATPATAQSTAQNGKQDAKTASGDNHTFKKLLTGTQQQNTTPVNAKAGDTASTPDKQPAPEEDSTHTTTDTTASSSVAAAFMLIQLQALPVAQANTQTTQTNPDASSIDTKQSQDIALLQSFLDQLLAQANTQAGTQASQTTDTNTAQSVATNTHTASPVQANPSEAQLAALAQLLLGQQPATQTADTQTNAVPTDTTAAIGSDQSKPVNDLLAKIAQLLQDQIKAAGPDNAPKAAAIPANVKATIDNNNSQFATTLSNLLGSSDTKDVFTRAIELLTSTQSDKQDSGDKNTDKSNPFTTNAANQVAPGILDRSQQSPDTGFVKFIATASAQQPVADQVLVQIKNAAADGASQIKIQLQPADLGKVTVQMNTGTDGKTGITITADNRQTLSMLQNEARSLENALRDIGLKPDAGGLNFNLSGQGQNQQQNASKQGSYTQVAAITSDDDMDYYTSATQLYRFSAQQGLDIRV